MAIDPGGGAHKASRLLRDEGGQTVLEYIIVIVFSTIGSIVFFRLVENIVSRTVNQVSASCDTD